MDDINYIIDLIVSYGPTALFLLIIFISTLAGLIRGLRKSLILATHAVCSATLCIILFFLLTRSELVDHYLLLMIDSVMGEGYLQNVLGVSGEFETVKQILVQAIPNYLDYGSSISILLEENSAYIYTLVDLVYNIAFAIVLLLVYYVLIFLLYIIYLIFYPERRFKRKKNKAFAKKETDRTYKKHPWFGSLVGLTRGLVAGCIMLSFLGSALYIVAGTGDGEMDEVSFNDPTVEMAYDAYRSIESYGTTGVYKILNTFKDANNQPYYLFVADLIFSGELNVEELQINENIKFREEIGAYTEFAKDGVNLLIKYGGKDITSILDGESSANMDVLVQVMKNEQFQADFETLIKDFDSKTYFINLAFAMVTSIVSHIEMFVEGLDPSIAELAKILFVKGHYSEYIPDEREAIEARSSLKNSKGKEQELEVLPYIPVSKIITREDVLTILNVVTNMITEETEEGETANALTTVKEIVPYLSELSIFQDKRKEEMNPVLGRLYCFVENKYLTNEGYDGITYAEIKNDNISWVDEINSLVSVAMDAIKLYENIYTEEKEVLDIILSVFDKEEENYAENIKLYDNVSETIANSKLLGKVLSSNKMVGVIKTALSSVSENIYLPDDIVFENKYDEDGNLIQTGEIQKVFSSLRILTDEENKGIIDSLFYPEEGTDMFDTLETISNTINNKDENGKSLVDYFLDSHIMHGIISSVLVDLGSTGDMMIYVPKASLEKVNNETVNLIKKHELNDILVALPEIIKEIKPVIEGEDAFAAIDSILENETIDSLLNSGNMIIEGTFSSVILNALSGVSMVKLPKELETVESWLSVNGVNGEFRNILAFVSDSSVDFETLINGEDKMSAIKDLKSEDIDLLLNSQVLHYTISNIISENAVDMGSFKVIVPASAKQKLENDSIPYLVKGVELKTLLEEFISLGLDTETDFSKVLIKFVERFLESEANGNSLLERSGILSASLINFLVNDNSISDFITMPAELEEEVTNTSTKGLDNYNKSYLWYSELPALIFALEEMFNISQKGEDFVLGGEGEDGDLVSQLSDVITSFREPSHIESKKDDYSRLDVIYDSRVMRHNLTNELEKSLTKSGTVSEYTINKAKEDGYIKKIELYAISDCMEIFGIDDLLNFDDQELIYNVKHEITRLNEPREEEKFKGRSGLDIMCDSVIITTLFSEKLDESLVKVVEDDVLTYEKVKVDGIYVKEELKALINGINALNITDMDNIGLHSFNVNEIRNNLSEIYKSNVLGGVFTKIIRDHTGDGYILKDHPYAYIQDSHYNPITIYSYGELETLLSIVPLDKDVEDVSYDDISLKEIKDAIYNEKEETKSYILLSTISYNLIYKESSTLIVPKHTLDLTISDEALYIQPKHIGQMLTALDRLGIDQLNSVGLEFDLTFPSQEHRRDILDSDIMRASFTSMIKEANNDPAQQDLITFSLDNIDEDEDARGKPIIIVKEEELIDLFEALEYFKTSDNSLSIPAINDLDAIRKIFEDEQEANALMDCDIFRYQIVGHIYELVILYNQLPTLDDIEYNTSIEEGYNVSKDTYELRYTATKQETENVVSSLHLM